MPTRGAAAGQPVDNHARLFPDGPEWGMRRKELPEHLTTGSFSVRASDKAGVTRSRTLAKDLVLVSRGIRMPAASVASGAAALRAYTDLDDSSILVSLSAARIWGIPLPGNRNGDWRIHLARRNGFSFPRRVNVAGHLLTLLPAEAVEYDGVRLTSPARTWLDLASLLSVEELVAAGDHLVCSHGPEFPCSQGSALQHRGADRDRGPPSGNAWSQDGAGSTGTHPRGR